MKTRIAASLILGLTFAFTTNHAHAQDALGAGNVLDSNLGVGTGGINPASAVPNFRDRNLVVTGDVIGGRGFRGSVGYTADADFRGGLGSNELFRFRADSAISSPPLFQLGSTYERLRFGLDLGLVEYRRAGSGVPATMHAQDPIIISDPRTRAQLDRRIVSTSTALAPQEIVEPRIVGATYAQDGTMLLIQASPVRGLTLERVGESVGMIGLGSYDAVRIREDIMQGRGPTMLGAEYETRFEHLRGLESRPQPDAQRDAESRRPTGDFDLQRDSQTGPQRIEGSLQPDYAQILNRVAERYATSQDVQSEVSPELLSRLDRDYQALREQLMGRALRDDEVDRRVQPPDWAPGTSPEPRPTTADGRPDFGVPRIDQRDPVTGLPPRRDEEQREPTPVLDFGAVLRHGQRIERLAGPTADRFNELLASAEAKLREGDFFTAERRFERALRFSPGHPMANVGMAHAQIGAGLYLSASLTLRTLFSAQPEMIDATYAPELIPTRERLTVAVAGITRRLQDAPERDRGSYGFVLAYIGHLTRDRALIDEGLTAMVQAQPDDPLLPLLRDIWQTDREAEPDGK